MCSRVQESPGGGAIRFLAQVGNPPLESSLDPVPPRNHVPPYQALCTATTGLIVNPSSDRDHFQLGSLSHLLNAKATGYQELPDWPEEAPDPSVRNVEVSSFGMCVHACVFMYVCECVNVHAFVCVG